MELCGLDEKLNECLSEVNDVLGNRLKGKKIELENQSVAQLYSRFLEEIFWDKKKEVKKSRKN